MDSAVTMHSDSRSGTARSEGGQVCDAHRMVRDVCVRFLLYPHLPLAIPSLPPCCALTFEYIAQSVDRRAAMCMRICALSLALPFSHTSNNSHTYTLAREHTRVHAQIFLRRGLRVRRRSGGGGRGRCRVAVSAALGRRQAGSHAAVLARFALAAVRAASETLVDEEDPGRGHVPFRVGLHSGPCMACVVGRKSPKYTLLGDTVRLA